ncbi:insulin receptor substrate 1-like isoform 2-T2 [Aulostomus maculatus]
MSLILVPVGSCGDWPSITIPLLSVRRFGHLDGSFFLELGRSAPTGPGEIWVEARDQGSQTLAQHIHEVVRDTVRALRALPDFSRSPTSNHCQLQTLTASKRSRPKNRDKPVPLRPLGSPPTRPPRSPDIHASPLQSYLKPDQWDLSPRRSIPETGSYMEMKTDVRLPLDEGQMTSEEPGPCVVEGLGYMMMSPQVSHSPDDYVTMTSPRNPTSSSLQTSFHSSASDPSYQTSDLSQPHRPPRQEQTAASSERLPAQAKPTTPSSSPRRRANTSVTRGPGYTRPVQTSPGSGLSRTSPSPAVPAARRHPLSLCLPFCLQAEDLECVQ